MKPNMSMMSKTIQIFKNIINPKVYKKTAIINNKDSLSAKKIIIIKNT
jgi:hypothetical protein